MPKADTATDWLPCPGLVNHGDAAVHLWLIQLEFVAEQMRDQFRILSDDERLRAERFRQPVDGQRYAAARTALRCVLGKYLTTEPGHVQFSYDQLGKPRLSEEVHRKPIRFSVSHSGAFGLLGFVLHRDIGVDLEQVRPDVEVSDLAARFFSHREAEVLASLNGQAQLDAFFRCWTRKEAYLKARGLGLSYGLDRVEVTLKSDEPAGIVSAADDPEVSCRWTFEHLTPAPGYIGASAVEGRDLASRHFTWSPGSGTA